MKPQLVPIEEHAFNRVYNISIFDIPAIDINFRVWDSFLSLVEMGDAFLDKVSDAGSEFHSLVNLWRLPIPTLRPDEKFLLVQPQFGIYNQIRAVFQSLAIARVLGRVLVIPDVVANNGAGPVVSRDKVFNSEKLVRLALGRAVTAEEYQKLVETGAAALPKKILELNLPIKQLTPTNMYFDSIGLSKVPRVVASIFPAFTQKQWRLWMERDSDGVKSDSTVALHATFMGWIDYKYTEKVRK